MGFDGFSLLAVMFQFSGHDFSILELSFSFFIRGVAFFSVSYVVTSFCVSLQSFAFLQAVV
jgi:hypothetical protein